MARIGLAAVLMAQVGWAQPATPTSSGTLDSNGIYTVQAGDTLYGIAGRYSVSVSEVMNPMACKMRGLSVGQACASLSRPAHPPQPAAAPQTTATHRVARGNALCYRWPIRR